MLFIHQIYILGIRVYCVLLLSHCPRIVSTAECTSDCSSLIGFLNGQGSTVSEGFISDLVFLESELRYITYVPPISKRVPIRMMRIWK